MVIPMPKHVKIHRSQNVHFTGRVGPEEASLMRIGLMDCRGQQPCVANGGIVLFTMRVVHIYCN